jgi:hypothetical protein
MILTIIDADGLCYHSSKNSIQESIESIDDRINNIIKETNCDYYTLFISQGRYFRHTISNNNYKIKRVIGNLKYLKTLKTYLIEQYNAASIPNVEADDLVAYWMNNLIYYNRILDIVTEKPTENTELVQPIMAAVDKDLLNSIPGKHFNYTYKFDGIETTKGWWVETNEEDAKRFIWKQMITGDTADSINGLHGKGEAYFNKISKDVATEDLPALIFNEYLKYWKTPSVAIYEYQLTFRLLHLLENDVDFNTEINDFPDAIIPIKVIKEEPSTILSIDDL